MSNEIARSLRKRMTPQETKLWVQLRAMRAEGYHFRRQAPLLGYVVDFACKSWRIVIEVDGGQHGFQTHVVRDRVRDTKLAEQGYVTLRFWNNDIDGNLPAVIERIRETLAQR